MKTVIDDLRNLQGMLLGGGSAARDVADSVEALRKRLPVAVLANFESMIGRGKTAIVAAVNGVCTGCHLQLSSGTAAALGRNNELGRCDNCGRYLYLQQAATATVPGNANFFMVPAADTASKPSRRRSKKPA